MKRGDLRKLCFLMAVLLIVCGAGGMVLSFLYLASMGMGDIAAGTSGFVAGAVLIGFGVLTLAVLSNQPDSK